MSNVLWAFAKLEARAPRLLEAAGAEVVQRADEFSARDMAEVLWAFAKLGHSGSPDAVQALITRMEHILRSGGEPDQALKRLHIDIRMHSSCVLWSTVWVQSLCV